MSPETETLTIRLADEDATAALAGALAPVLEAGTTIHLSGDLGSGKTAFTRALLRALGHTGRARSPTFTLVEPYNLSRFNLYHFDFYRLSTYRAWLDAGFDEYLDGQAVVVIEWPEMAGDTLPAPDLLLRIRFDTEAGADARTVDSDDRTAGSGARVAAGDARIVEATARGPRGLACLKAIRDAGCCGPAPGQAPARR